MNNFSISLEKLTSKPIKSCGFVEIDIKSGLFYFISSNWAMRELQSRSLIRVGTKERSRVIGVWWAAVKRFLKEDVSILVMSV